MNISMACRPGARFVLTFILSVFALIPANLLADQVTPERSDVMSAFTEAADQKDVAKSTTDEKFRHQLLFFMGLMLLIFIFSTAYFGLSMALFGKDVFVQHMVCAGVTVFLALVHAVVAVVWFFPF